ncbi:uncharacterized protein [Euphorbia lathyris]|uniref:uncharacterized protein n=1 Tax=Euphorbia lathyris TaxID=212925 RepID=UPI00331309B9
MAKRSDFAQKLLDDLRMRKEQLPASHSSKSSKPIAGDAYSHSKQAYRGSREMNMHQNTHLKSGRTHRSTGGNKSVSIRGGPEDIVPLGRGRSSEQFGDLSMALTFALENGGEITRTDSSNNSLMLGFLNQIGRRSVQTGKVDGSSIAMHNTSTRHFPSLSHLHINEIAKGAEKLNQILRACSNGLKFDRYSIEIGKELLKGAIDLEESLRMLVNLQEASDYMIEPQNKARITLLDDDEDDNDNTVKIEENKQLGRPIFSFDKPSRNSRHIQEAARAELKQRLMALTYQSENANYSNSRKNLSTSNSASQRFSASTSPSMQPFVAFSEQKNHPNSTKAKPETGRIPNVIAKLMGLEGLPENDDPKHIIKKESTHKDKIERTVTKKTGKESTTQEWKTKDAENLVSSIRKHKETQPNQIQVTQDSHDLQAQRNLSSRPTSFDGTIHDRKPPQKEMKSSNKATDNRQNNTDQSTPNTGSRRDIRGKEKKMDSAKPKEQKDKERSEIKEPIVKQQLQKMTSQTEKVFDAAITLQGQAESNSTMLKTERRNAYEQPLSSLAESPVDLASQQPRIHQNFEVQEMKHHAAESNQQSGKRHIQVTAHIGSEHTSLPKPMQDNLYLPRKHSYRSQETSSNGSSIDLSRGIQSMGLPNTRHQEDVVQDRNFLNFKMSAQDSMNKNSIENSSPRNLYSDVIKEKSRSSVTTDMQEKTMHKVKVTKMQKAETSGKNDELLTRSTNLHARISKHQNPVLQEVKQRRHNKLSRSNEGNHVRLSRSREADTRILKSNKIELSTDKPNALGELQIQAEKDSSFCTPPTDNECQNLKGPEIALDGNLSTGINDQQGQGVNRKLQSHSNKYSPLNRICGGRKDATHPELQKRHEPVLETPEPLTESENNLMQILVKTRLFLNTAEALFKLNIPLGILHASSIDCHCEGSKLILDCGYEVMRRKGKRKEFSYHPFMNIYITPLKVRSLDELIKQLHKDLEKLKFYGRNDKIECAVEEYLPKMLELDVYNKDPDVNCMWDFGWHKMMFMSLEKEDVIKDVEKHVLNGLLDELTKDLLVF